MNRRNFIQNTSLGALAPAFTLSSKTGFQSDQKEWYEWRTYELRFRGNRALLLAYLTESLKPAMIRQGANHFMLFSEYGLTDPAKLHVIISYPSMEVFAACQRLESDEAYQNSSASYASLPPEQTLYNRITSSLLQAFDGLPALLAPPESSGLFELRIYEGYSEDAVRRKIRMFNVEEIDLFYRTGLNPVFFGDMIIGPARPALVYMLHFRDMAERDANWETFLAHEEWLAMLANPEYANTVENIQRVFLTRTET